MTTEEVVKRLGVSLDVSVDDLIDIIESGILPDLKRYYDDCDWTEKDILVAQDWLEEREERQKQEDQFWDWWGRRYYWDLYEEDY